MTRYVDDHGSRLLGHGVVGRIVSLVLWLTAAIALSCPQKLVGAVNPVRRSQSKR